MLGMKLTSLIYSGQLFTLPVRYHNSNRLQPSCRLSFTSLNVVSFTTTKYEESHRCRSQLIGGFLIIVDVFLNNLTFSFGGEGVFSLSFRIQIS